MSRIKNISITVIVVVSLFSPYSILVDAREITHGSTTLYYQQELFNSNIGTGSVDKFGSANYSYPLGQVSLSYNSDNGWQISGASSISICSRKGVPAGFSIDDPFEYLTYQLDGRELIRIDDGSDPNILEFRTKIDSRNKLWHLLR